MNRVEVRGGLTKDADLRWVGQNNTALAEMTLAVNGARYDHQRGEQVVHSVFVTVQMWGLLAEDVMNRYALQKGDEVYVIGELDQREVEKRDGTKDRKTRVVALQVSVLRSKTRREDRMPPTEPHDDGPPPPENPF